MFLNFCLSVHSTSFDHIDFKVINICLSNKSSNIKSVFRIHLWFLGLWVCSNWSLKYYQIDKRELFLKQSWTYSKRTFYFTSEYTTMQIEKILAYQIYRIISKVLSILRSLVFISCSSCLNFGGSRQYFLSKVQLI